MSTKTTRTAEKVTLVSSKLVQPLSPYLILVVAIFLPGLGQVLNNATKRGLLMLLFMVVLGYMTHQVADANVSNLGQYAGGFFVYAISVMDAYYWGKYRIEIFKRSLIKD